MKASREGEEIGGEKGGRDSRGGKKKVQRGGGSLVLNLLFEKKIR